MKKFYIISNYITALYELDEAGLCKIKGQNSITIDEVIENFKKNVSVKAFGIIRAYIQEHTEDGKWIVINDIIPPKKKNSKDGKLFTENEVKEIAWKAYLSTVDESEFELIHRNPAKIEFEEWWNNVKR